MNAQPTPDDLARDLAADLARALNNDGPTWGPTPNEARLAYSDFAERCLPSALRRALAAEAYQADAADRFSAVVRQRDAAEAECDRLREAARRVLSSAVAELPQVWKMPALLAALEELKAALEG